ncbi:MAG: radical SAM protein [Gammaproteobacteria bacterium]|nr:radical SAM protein [Gammaproteobacteria bacterium]
MLNYDMPLYRPPSEGRNLIIQVTYGCSFNQCSFCSMYREKRYQARPLEEVFQEIEQAALQWPGAHRVFLADGDALALPTAQLIAILERLAPRFPKLARVSCYATPSNILHKSAAELERLKAHKLTLLYLGVESGAGKILKKITKGATPSGITKAMQRAYDANMKVSATVILGLGGQQYWQEHVEGTVEVINSAPLSYLSTLQLGVEPEIYGEFERKFGEPFQWQDDLAMLEEQRYLIEHIDPPKPLIFRSNHASNALALAGNLPRDRERLLQQIEQVMSGEGEVRPQLLRGF